MSQEGKENLDPRVSPLDRKVTVKPLAPPPRPAKPEVNRTQGETATPLAERLFGQLDSPTCVDLYKLKMEQRFAVEDVHRIRNRLNERKHKLEPIYGTIYPFDHPETAVRPFRFFGGQHGLPPELSEQQKPPASAAPPTVAACPEWGSDTLAAMATHTAAGMNALGSAHNVA